MAPGNNACTGLLVISFSHDIEDILIAFCCELINQWVGESFAECCGHLLSTGIYGI